MKEAKLRILVVDDDLIDLEPVYELMNQSVLAGQYEIVECECVEEIPVQLMGVVNNTGLQTIESLAKNGANIDIAFLDRQFDKEFNTDIDIGPRKMISAIQQFSPLCKVLLVSRKGGLARGTYVEIKGIPAKRFRTIGKFQPELVMITIFDIVKEWSKDFLKKNLTRKEKERIVLAVKKSDIELLPVVKTVHGIWKPRTYLAPYFLYLHQQGNNTEIDAAAMDAIELTRTVTAFYQPKLKCWNSATSNFALPLSKYYETYLEWPERSEERLNQAAASYIRQYLRAEINDLSLPDNPYNFSADIKSNGQTFDFVNQLETILIGRRIAVGLFMMGFTENAILFALKSKPRLLNQISEDEKRKASPTQLFSTFFALSLKTDVPLLDQDRNYEDFENILEEEVDWLKSFFEMDQRDRGFLSWFISEAQGELKAVSHDPLLRKKIAVYSYSDAEVVIVRLLSLIEEEGLKEAFLRIVNNELLEQDISEKMLIFLKKFLPPLPVSGR